MAGFSKDKWPSDGAVRALLEYLDELHRDAGQPSYAEMGKEVALAPSTLAPFFTGTRLINKGNLEVVVRYLAGDTAKAERLRRKAVIEWPTRPTAAPVSLSESEPAQNRLLFLFKAGCSVGGATVLQLTASDQFEEFLDALRIIGLKEGEIEPLCKIRSRLEQATSGEAGRGALVAYAGVLEEVISLIKERTSSDEFRWFRLGKSLQSIALVAATAWPADPGIEDERTELFYLSDVVEMPDELRADVKGYCQLKLPTIENMEMLRVAHRLSRAFYAIL
ncbi:hypothetical protein ACFC4C_10640 [Streptomyces sp. NPDC056039]|uniref:hypothetical protein n=1 Tax=Streptomyces sp. NPDC056039 TaxID=3345687 RepID=UPI0035DD602A